MHGLALRPDLSQAFFPPIDDFGILVKVVLHRLAAPTFEVVGYNSVGSGKGWLDAFSWWLC